MMMDGTVMMMMMMIIIMNHHHAGDHPHDTLLLALQHETLAHAIDEQLRQQQT